LLYAYSVQTSYAAPNVTVTCTTACTTSYTYKIDVLDAYGNIVASSLGQTVSNNSTLSGTNKNQVFCPSSFTTFDGNTPTCTIYRTAGGATQGAIGTGVALGGSVTDNPLGATTASNPDTIVSNGATVNLCAYSIKANVLGTGNRNITAVIVFTRTGTTSATYGWSYGSNVVASGSNGNSGGQNSTLRFGNNPGVTNAQWGISANIPSKAGQSGTTSTSPQTLAYTFNVAGTSDTITPGGCDAELVY
jgi:hypothetical protein